MKRGQGIIAAALVFAGGAVFRAPMQQGGGEARNSAKTVPTQSAAQAATEVGGDGPWKASCNYWKPGIVEVTPKPARKNHRQRPGRVSERHSKSKELSNLSVSITTSSSAFDERLSGTISKDVGCGSDEWHSWGIPKNTTSGAGGPRITAIIATVPDPLQSSTPWEFDRVVEVLRQAAAQYKYVGSYFWLPWQRSAEKSETASTAKADTADSEDRLKQPGLLIFKQVNAIPGTPFEAEDCEPNLEQSSSAHSRTTATRSKAPSKPIAATPKDCQAGVLYLFLVGQSPSVGVNGDQLQHALEYERVLSAHGARLSFKDDHELDVIGPEYSGAAASLRAGLQTENAVGIGKIKVAGATSTMPAKEAIVGSSPSGAIQYISFQDDIINSQETICSRFTPRGTASTELAFLVESGTVFGMSETPGAENTESAQNLDAQGLPGTDAITISPGGANSEGKDTPTANKQMHEPQPSACKNPIEIQFPLNISLLRNAETEDLGGTQSVTSASSTPYLRLSLKDTSQSDTVPPFSSSVTPYSQEAQWMAIVRQLVRANVKTIVVSASNSLDEIFLVKSLHRDVPDARVVVYDGGDLLFARVGDDQAYLGTVTIGAYPLSELKPAQPGSNNLLGFADGSLVEAMYNAAVYTFWDQKDLSKLHLAGYSSEIAKSSKSADSSKGGEGSKTSDNSQSSKLEPRVAIPPPLWATAVGRDGYYPLGIAAECASETGLTMPAIDTSGEYRCTDDTARTRRVIYTHLRSTPGFSWYLICIALAALALAQTLTLLAAHVWSPLTRDLAIEGNDQPRRRAVYVHIATAALFSMCMITTIPVWTASAMIEPGVYTWFISITTAICGLLALIVTLIETRKYLGSCSRQASVSPGGLETNMRHESAFYQLFNVVAAATAVGVPVLWLILCTNLPVIYAGSYTSAGIFFAFRCLYPLSGVSPLIPVLFILLTWYIWAALQTRRLRFSENCRPILPSCTELSKVGFYVSDDSLSACCKPTDHCLFENIESLLITRQMVRRHIVHRRWAKRFVPYLNWWMALAYTVVFCCFVLCVRVRGLGHFLRPNSVEPVLDMLRSHLSTGAHHLVNNAFFPVNHIPELLASHLPGWYELLISALFFPLLIVSITGWLRMTVVWVALRNGLLEPLERSPLRFAFSRLSNVSWMAMMQQGGMFEHWMDMVRSRESMQQLVRRELLWKRSPDPERCAAEEAKRVHAITLDHIAALLPDLEPRITEEIWRKLDECIARHAGAIQTMTPMVPLPDPLFGCDLPNDHHTLSYMYAIEKDYARFAELLLNCVLVPYWLTERHSLVQAESEVPSGFENEPEETPNDKTKHQPKPENGDLQDLHLAEEYVVIRYVSLIRAVMINIRVLMTFVSVSFVLALLAWNSYPFQPKQWVDWTFTILLFGFGAGVIWVLAQMYRNPILSRITGTKINELGGEFFWRVVAYGAVPVLTWIGSQVPAIGNLVSKVLSAGFTAAK